MKQSRMWEQPRLLHLLVNLMVAIFVVIVLHQNEVLFLNQLKNSIFDQLMYWQSHVVPMTSKGQIMQRMALVAIDDQTYRDWGSPLVTPRQWLQALIEQVRQGGANVIVVDLNLTRLSDGCFHERDKTPVCSPVHLNADVALGLYLQRLNENFNDINQYDTPIILLNRTYRQPLDTEGYINQDAFLEKPAAFLENYFEEENNVFWTTTVFQADADQVQRRWPLTYLACENNHLTVVPSMPLLAAMAQLYSCKDSTRKAAYMIRDLKQRLNAWAQTLPCDPNQGTTLPQLCRQVACPDFTLTMPNKTGVCDKVHTIDLAKGLDAERIVYRLAPIDDSMPSSRHLMDLFRALDVLKNGIQVDQQIVFIGPTHADHSNYHRIPIRHHKVASIYSVANAVDTLLRFGQFQPHSLVYKISIVAVLAIIISLILTYYRFIIALVFSTLLIGLVLWMGSRGTALQHGIGVDMALAGLIIQLIEVIKKFVTKLIN